jgi:pentatricopeptide repeat protein
MTPISESQANPANGAVESVQRLLTAAQDAQDHIRRLQQSLSDQAKQIQQLQAEVDKWKTESQAYKSAIYALTKDEKFELTEEFLRDMKENGIPFEQVIVELDMM